MSDQDANLRPLIDALREAFERAFGPMSLGCLDSALRFRGISPTTPMSTPPPVPAKPLDPSREALIDALRPFADLAATRAVGEAVTLGKDLQMTATGGYVVFIPHQAFTAARDVLAEENRS